MKRSTMMKGFRVIFYITLLIPFLFSVLQPSIQATNQQSLVYVVPVESNIERGLQVFMERAFQEAEEAGADHIIVEISTFGGAVDAAAGIGDLLQQTQIPITAFVRGKAISAGAYIALNADQIVMTPGSTMGAATVVDSAGNAGEAKAMSYWIQAMAEAASVKGRDPQYAKAMVDIDMEIEGVVKKGEVLTFGANDALQYGYAEKIVNTRAELIDFLELEQAKIVEVATTVAEKIARFVTSPVVMPILFSLGSLGLMLELYSPGFGIPGTIGVSALLLFFFGHMIAGFAGWESLLLFIVGIILIIIEIFVPGFGIFGILGVVSIIGGLTLASFDYVVGLQSVGWATLITIIVGGILLKYTNKKGLWTKLVLEEGLEEEESQERFQSKKDLVGKTGRALTKLRPAGAIQIEDRRFDAVSEGGIIEKDQLIRVIYVDGTRIVVSPFADTLTDETK
ncbi:NfeD family protein [Caldalkalibacillus mannanilyticus]|uniref:NfeD family protein n=1 Tax=Caldalkalibacillus mannanilyticus TaxID=1418 RepID=UPI00046856E9|nr:nodulation protein NfeD [Caldalkalibacillus mannanilyticus]